jgi:hypothetical protein
VSTIRQKAYRSLEEAEHVVCAFVAQCNHVHPNGVAGLVRVATRSRRDRSVRDTWDRKLETSRERQRLANHPVAPTAPD